MKPVRRLLLLVSYLFAAMTGHGGVAWQFEFVFGTNNTTDQRVKRMKPETFFISRLQIEFARAVAGRNTNEMQRLLVRGADVNCKGSRGMNPLFWAIINESIQGVQFLLNNGANPNAPVEAKQPPADNALTLAAFLKDPRFLEALLRHGANPNAPVAAHRETAIFTAAFYNRHKHISLLLAHGADINWETVGSDTVLHAAIQQTAYATALFLYRAGANPLIKASYGYNSIDTLKKFGDNLILRRSDRGPYKQLLKELREAGFLDG